MLFILLLCLFGGLIIYGLLYLVYGNKKADNSRRVTFLTRSACIIGGLNMVLGVMFLTHYFFNPAGFSEHAAFSSPAAYWLFTIFANYFYLLAMPLSIGLMGIAALAKKQNKLSLKTYLFTMPANTIGVLTIAALSAILFP